MKYIYTLILLMGVGGTANAELGTHNCNQADILLAVDVSQSTGAALITQKTQALQVLSQLQAWGKKVEEKDTHGSVDVSESLLFRGIVEHASSKWYAVAKENRTKTLLDFIPTLTYTTKNTKIYPVLKYAYEKFGAYESNNDKPYPILVILTDGISEFNLQRHLDQLLERASILDIGEKKRYNPEVERIKSELQAELDQYTGMIRTLRNNNIITIVVPIGSSLDAEEIKKLSTAHGEAKTLEEKLNYFTACRA